MKVYRSRVGREICVPAILLFAFVIYKTNASWPVVIILLLVGCLLTVMIFKIRYIITNDKLLVRCWPVVNFEIDIQSIQRIRETWDPLSSPAATYFGRIEVHYGMGKSCIISPVNKREFIKDLQKKNASIRTLEVIR